MPSYDVNKQDQPKYLPSEAELEEQKKSIRNLHSEGKTVYGKKRKEVRPTIKIVATVRGSLEEQAHLLRLAKAEGMSLNNYIRKSLGLPFIEVLLEGRMPQPISPSQKDD